MCKYNIEGLRNPDYWNMAKVGRNIAAIVVTYNRKELLAECLEAICMQEYKPACVYIIDNASTDGTDEWIKDNGYDGPQGQIEFRYVRLSENIGGSGGFYTGLKMAHEAAEKFDAFWLMDDDGVADKAQLKYLIAHLDKYDYLAPLVISKEDPTRCAFYNMSVEEFKDKAIDGLVPDLASPFNGVLYSRKLVDTVGYPLRDMFIWGDENDYHGRCICAGFRPMVEISAIHIHPKDRQIRQKLFWRKYVVPSQDWKLYLYVRNRVFNSVTFSNSGHIVRVVFHMVLEYSYYIIIKEHSWHRLRVFYRAVYDGLHKDLSRLSYYKK